MFTHTLNRITRTADVLRLRCRPAALAALVGLGLLLFGVGTALAQSAAPSVTAVAISSSAGADRTYALDETIEVTLTFSEAVEVSGTPRLAIDMDPADWGSKWADYEGGSGTSRLTFAHTVVEPNYSSQGVAVLAGTLELNGGTIASASSGSAPRRRRR